MVAPGEGDARRRGSRSRAWARAAGRPVLRTSTLQVEQLEECCQPALLATSAALPYAVAPPLQTSPNQVTLDHEKLAAFANSPLQFRGQSLASSFTAPSAVARIPYLVFSASAPGQVSTGQFRLASTASQQMPSMTSQTQTATILHSATSIGTLATLRPQRVQSPQSQSVLPISLVQRQRLELVIVDPLVADYQKLVADLSRNDPTRHLDVIILRSDRDGIEQVTRALARYQHLDAVHLITHGAANGIVIGDTWLNSLNVASYSAQLRQWRLALAPHADLLFYACNLAQNDVGLNAVLRRSSP